MRRLERADDRKDTDQGLMEFEQMYKAMKDEHKLLKNSEGAHEAQIWESALGEAFLASKKAAASRHPHPPTAL